MAAKFEKQQKSREVFQAWMPRSSGAGETSSSGHTTPAPGQKRSGFRSPAPPAKVPTGRGWQRHPFRPPAQPAAQQQPAARPAQGAAQAPRQHSARRGEVGLQMNDNLIWPEDLFSTLVAQSSTLQQHNFAPVATSDLSVCITALSLSPARSLSLSLSFARALSLSRFTTPTL